MNSPPISIVVALIAGGQEPTATCLAAIEAGVKQHDAEVLVPYDHRLDGFEELARRFPWAQFIDCRSQIDANRYGRFSREHHDILRAIGLNRARGKILALLEDHGTPGPDWISTALRVHEKSYAGVGGTVDNGVNKLLNWAVYYCDFGRYQAPVSDGPSEFISDSNCAYKREALEAVKDCWHDAFHETFVNWKLREMGRELRLDPGMVVYQTRTGLTLGAALTERFVWGRSFAGTRAKGVSTAKRLIYAAFSFLLPFVLTGRILARGLGKRRAGKVLACAPLIFLLETIWSVGEFVGYATGRPQ
ncbi:MAG: hypothetical protein U1D55_12705 [Phycisphaerae bacterium]